MIDLRQFWVKAITTFRHPSLHRDAFFLSSATIASGLGSLIYWKLITMRFSAEMVGLTSVGITSATFLAGFSNLGLTSGLVRFLPNQNMAIRAGLIRVVNLISLIMGLPVSIIFLWGRQWWAPNLIPLQAGSAYLMFFLLLLFSTIQMNINGAVFQALRHTPYLLVQSMIINLVQIAGGIVVAVDLGVKGVLFTYMLPILVVAVGFYFVIPHLGHFAGIMPYVDYGTLPDLIRYGLGTQIYYVLWQLPTFVFPLMTLGLLGPRANAGLVLSWYAYSFLAIIPQAIMSALLVEGSYEPSDLGQRLENAFILNLVFLTPVVVCVLALAPWMLSFFGTFYTQSALLLRLLALSILPVSINGLYITLLRVRKQMLRLNIYVAVLIIGSISLVYLAIRHLGLNGIGWGWLTGQFILAFFIVILILRKHRRAYSDSL